MSGVVNVATVADVSPFTVRPKGSVADVPVQRRTVTVPADLAEGERVLIAVVDRQVTFLGRWDAV